MARIRSRRKRKRIHELHRVMILKDMKKLFYRLRKLMNN